MGAASRRVSQGTLWAFLKPRGKVRFFLSAFEESMPRLLRHVFQIQRGHGVVGQYGKHLAHTHRPKPLLSL